MATIRKEIVKKARPENVWGRFVTWARCIGDSRAGLLPMCDWLSLFASLRQQDDAVVSLADLAGVIGV